MRIIEILQLENGAHRNQTAVFPLPDGWAIIPDNLPCENYPFGDAIISEISGVKTVINWSPLPIPETPSLDNRERIEELKQLLSDTDYQAIKYAEGWISDEDYAPIKEQRQEWRNEINELMENE